MGEDGGRGHAVRREGGGRGAEAEGDAGVGDEEAASDVPVEQARGRRRFPCGGVPMMRRAVPSRRECVNTGPLWPCRFAVARLRALRAPLPLDRRRCYDVRLALAGRTGSANLPCGRAVGPPLPQPPRRHFSQTVCVLVHVYFPCKRNCISPRPKPMQKSMSFSRPKMLGRFFHTRSTICVLSWK